ncbi:MAG: methyltransferase domain-containing protein [Lewinellaceae bacterium]|nr:methyltransferase domain-containing protein [Lewinellaceae bacterium]
MNKDLVRYYAERAAEYEKVYDKPERQLDHQRLVSILQDIFHNKNLLEIACGTGWFTQRLAPTAASIFATDINETVLEIARAKNYPRENVQFQCDDIFQTKINRRFAGLFAGFIWSHILLDKLDVFLTQCLRWVEPGGTLVFVDNLFIPGSSTPLHHADEQGNSYQLRRLADGTEHLVLKNFPEPAFLRQVLEKHGLEVEVAELGHYWMAVCRCGGSGK